MFWWETVRQADYDELPEHCTEHCTQTDEEAGSNVFHVGNDTNEKEMTDSVGGAVCYEEEITMAYKREEANEAAAAKIHLNRMMRSQRKMGNLEDLSRIQEAHPKERKNDWKIWANKKNASVTRKDQKDKKRFKEYLKTWKGSGTFQESNLQEEEYSSPR